MALQQGDIVKLSDLNTLNEAIINSDNITIQNLWNNIYNISNQSNLMDELEGLEQKYGIQINENASLEDRLKALIDNPIIQSKWTIL